MKISSVIITAFCLSSLSSCDRLQEFAGLTDGVEDVLEKRNGGKFEVIVGDASLVEELKKERGTILVVDYYRDDCPSCVQMAPEVEKMAAKYGEKVVVVKMDLGSNEANQVYSVEEGVKGIPTLDFFLNGRKVKRLVGGMDESLLEQSFSQIVTDNLGDDNDPASRVILKPVEKNSLPAGVERIKKMPVETEVDPISLKAGKMTPLNPGTSK